MGLIPGHVYPDVTALRPELLKKQGITLVLVDLDNTLTPYQEGVPADHILHWRRELAAAGIDLFILSNSRKPARVKAFAQALGVPFLGNCCKPLRKGYLRALEEMGRRPEETLMVGDQIFTDIWGGNRVGVRTVLVPPVRLAGNPGRYLRFGVETPFRLLGKRRGGL